MKWGVVGWGWRVGRCVVGEHTNLDSLANSMTEKWAYDKGLTGVSLSFLLCGYDHSFPSWGLSYCTLGD